MKNAAHTELDAKICDLLSTGPKSHRQICLAVCNGNSPNVRHVAISLQRLCNAGIARWQSEKATPMIELA